MGVTEVATVTGVAVDEVARARSDFLRHGRLPSGASVRPQIAASWKRSVLYGLSPSLERAIRKDLSERESQLLRAARPVVDGRREILKELRCGLTLTDADGRLLARWVTNAPFSRRLDARRVHPGVCIAEPAIGTNSAGVALELGCAVQVSGPEHFADAATSMATAGAPIRHPLTRRVAGTINIIAELPDSSPLLLAWIREVGTAIEHQLSMMVNERKRALLDAYLGVARDARHPVVCLDDQTLISSAAAARLVQPNDQAYLWELASGAVHGEVPVSTHTTLSNGRRVYTSVRPVTVGTARIGAVIKLKPEFGDDECAAASADSHTQATRASDANAASLPGLVGRSSSWMTFCADALTGLQDHHVVVLVGEPGSGKTAAAEALLQGKRIHRTSIDPLTDDPTAEAILIEGLESADPSDLARLAAFGMTTAARGALTVATCTKSSEVDPFVSDFLIEWPGMSVHLPALRDRREDIAELLRSITSEELGRSGGPEWLAETVQVLCRLRWERNIVGLRSLVREVLAKGTGAYVRVTDLPPAIRAQASRRQLAGMEAAEAIAIAGALKRANGNKKVAADELGIARSTLYRKVRALGLDLSSSNY